jgi:hypothetical protein
MKTSTSALATALMSLCMAFAAGNVVAQDAPGNGVPQPRQGPAKKLTVQDCKDRMAAPTDGAKTDDAAAAKMDKRCARLMKKQAAMTNKDTPVAPAKP